MFASWNQNWLSAKRSFEQCEQGSNIAALERIIKAPNNFGA